MNKTHSINQKILITGAAGFIGFHLARHYQHHGYTVIGADNGDYFLTHDIRRMRADILRREGVVMESGDLSQQWFADEIFSCYRPHIVFHMAAHTGARCQNVAQINNDNIMAVTNMLSSARKNPPAHFLFASSSSVYGEHAPRPFCENFPPVMPTNLYAASKFVGEQIARFEAMRSDFKITCIRFFNVYGPWGRTDMAPFYFADCLTHEREIKIITGDARRAWLYIGDAVNACIKLVNMPRCFDDAPCIVNVAGPRLMRTYDVLSTIARRMNKLPRLIYCPPESPEVTSNPADMRLLESLIGWVPQTIFANGIENFLTWYAREWLLLINQQEKTHV